MACLIDDETEGPDLVLPGGDKEATLFGLWIAPTASRGDYLGEAAMLVGIDCRDHDPVFRVIAGKGFAITRAGFTSTQRPAMDRLPSIWPTVAQGLFGLTAFKAREKVRPSGRDSGPGGIFLVPATNLPQQGMDLGIAIR